MSEVKVTIDRLAFGGSGVCRIDGKVCFVPYSCPGDQLHVKLTGNKKSYCNASIVEITSPSDLRAIPECPIFGKCGGCSWQHINYPEQLVQKREILTETLWRGARVSAEKIENIIPAPFKYGYRGRFQFKTALKNGKLNIGFYRQGSHEVEDAGDWCPVALPVINRTLKKLRGVLASYSSIESVFQLTINAGDNSVIVIIHQNRTITPEGESYLVEQVKKHSVCTGLFLKVAGNDTIEKIWGSSDISYSMTSLHNDNKAVELYYPPGGFAQVNQAQNIEILSVIRRLGSFVDSDRLLDLYCGNGNFSLPLSAEVADVTGVEANPDSIRAAEFNAEFNHVKNASFFCDDVPLALRRFADRKEKFNILLLDPPRSGVGEAVSDIVRLQPERLIYVSCDPSTLARDCSLLNKSGYSVITSVPIDMFPQSFHIESVTLLSKGKDVCESF
ncbi:MAG: 23S rRNA (uracil(1939)-C(5))-methyltransferase RlmD [Desulfuromonadaceae bacterium]|nr:23S rRNA (uracil(1939)-C(5))-methyltransferase RlmD [Desulfuromonadaceae bacterium]MDD2855484.1 23S rRNA (uracil(1939)-C(5))-methyltransferase RlmD [Desulfuromonadaceae bacterium]